MPLRIYWQVPGTLPNGYEWSESRFKRLKCNCKALYGRVLFGVSLQVSMYVHMCVCWSNESKCLYFLPLEAGTLLEWVFLWLRMRNFKYKETNQLGCTDAWSRLHICMHVIWDETPPPGWTHLQDITSHRIITGPSLKGVSAYCFNLFYKTIALLHT